VKSEFLALTGYYIVVVLTILEINNVIYTIRNIYAPNNMNKRNTFFKQVDRSINEHSIGQIILAGDYNDRFQWRQKNKIFVLPLIYLSSSRYIVF
jgi:nicotinamide riboside kinase